MLLPIFYTGDKPTIYQIENMKGKDGENLNIIGRIASRYKPFGIQLLQDANGERVEVIRSDHINEGVEAITTAILQEWLKDRKLPHTYSYLIKCIEAARLGALAEDIENSLQYK